MANRPKVVDLEKKRKSRSGTVWDGERLKLAVRDREKEAETEQRQRPASRKKLLAAAALVIAAVMLGSLILNIFL